MEMWRERCQGSYVWKYEGKGVGVHLNGNMKYEGKGVGVHVHMET